MKTSVYLSNRAIAAVSGTAGRGGLRVEACHRAQLPWGLVYNGTAADPEPLAAQLADFWRANRLPKSGVSLVVDSDAVIGRALEVPPLPPRQLRRVIQNTLTIDRSAGDYVYDYAVMPAGAGEGGRIYALAAERRYIQSLAALFATIGVRLNGIDLAPLCAMGFFDAEASYRGRTFIYTRLEGPDILSLLFSGGGYAFIDRGQLMERRGSPAAAVEITRAIESMAQYNYASRGQNPLSHVYISGLEGEETQFYGDMTDTLGLGVGPLAPAARVTGLPQDDWGAYLFCLGDLLC